MGKRQPKPRNQTKRRSLGRPPSLVAKARPTAHLLALNDDGLRHALAHVPLSSHGAFKQVNRRLRALGTAPTFRRARADSGCEETVLLVSGGTDARDDTWSETTFILSADGWRTRERQIPNPMMRLSARALPDLSTGDNGCSAVVGGELLVVGPVVHFGLPSSSFMSYDINSDKWSDSYTHARRSRRCPRPCPPLPAGRRFAACGAVGGRLIVCGGETEEAVMMDEDDELMGCTMEITDECSCFDVEAREWRAGGVAAMPLGVAHAAYAVLGGKLYVAGGIYTQGLQDGLEDESDRLQIYDPASDSWTSEPIEVPVDEETAGEFGIFPGSCVGVALGDELVVVCGGSREHHLVDDGDEDDAHFELVEAAPRTFAFDARRKSWRELTPLPELREGFSACVHAGDLYVIGGVSASDAGAPPLIFAGGAWKELEGAPPEMSSLERPAVASVTLG